MRSLPLLLLLLAGCGGTAPVAPEAGTRDPARVFARARELEGGRKTKQAVAAYRQIVLQFPDSPEARDAARRIFEVQRAAIRNVAARRSR